MSSYNLKVFIFFSATHKAQMIVPLEFTLSVESRREGHIIQCTFWCSLSSVWCHASYTVFCLLWRQFPAEFISCYVGLEGGEGGREGEEGKEEGGRKGGKEGGREREVNKK